MITLQNTSHDRKSPTAYASDAIYLLKTAVAIFPIGTQVRLVGETPETLGVHRDKGYVTVTAVEHAPEAIWLGVLPENLEPNPFAI